MFYTTFMPLMERFLKSFSDFLNCYVILIRNLPHFTDYLYFYLTWCFWIIIIIIIIIIAIIIIRMIIIILIKIIINNDNDHNNNNDI